MVRSEHRNHVQSIAVRNGIRRLFPPRDNAAEAELILERYAATSQKVSAAIRFLPAEPKSETPKSETAKPWSC